MSLKYRVRAEKEAKEKKDRAKYCLKSAREWMTFILLIATVFFTYKTLETSTVQVQEAKKATIAARQQADAASRAYVFASVSGGESIIDWTFEKNLIAVPIAIENYGAAPAVVNRVGCVIAWGARENPPNDAISVAETDDRSLVRSGFSPGEVIGSGKTINTAFCNDGWPRNDDTLAATAGDTSRNRREIINMRGPIWVVVVINYSDISGNQHKTVTCAMNDGGIKIVPAGGPDCQYRD